MTGLSGQSFCTIRIKVYFLWLQVDKDLDVNVMNFLPVRSFVFKFLHLCNPSNT